MAHNPVSHVYTYRRQLYNPLAFSLLLAAWILCDPYFLTFIIFPYKVCVNCANGLSIDLMIESTILPKRFVDLPAQLYLPPIFLLAYSASWSVYIIRASQVQKRLACFLVVTGILVCMSIISYWSLLREYRSRLTPSALACAKLIVEGHNGRANVELGQVLISTKYRSAGLWRPDTLYTSVFGSKCEIVHLRFDEDMKVGIVQLSDPFLMTTLQLQL
ncbi:hypothetical protein [Lacunimicrobium album]